MAASPRPGPRTAIASTHAKGEQLVLEVNARRLGSDLDSFLEVLDAKGNPIERAVVRPVWETTITLRDHDSAGRGIRIAAWDSLQVGDYVMVGAEILRIEAMPLSPDDDTVFEAFGGQRLAFFDTSSEAHAIDSPVYKVQIHPPGTKLSPNGLPVAHLYYRNDDGGPGYGKDSAGALHRAGRWRVPRAHPRCPGPGRRELRVPPDRAPAASGFPADGEPAESQCAGGRQRSGDRHGVSHGWLRRADRCGDRRICPPACRPPTARSVRARFRPRSF